MLEIAIVAESPSYIFEVIWTLKVISLEKSIDRIGTFRPVPDLISNQVNALQPKNSVIFVYPEIDSNY